jgi:hypothetical protein
MPRPPVRPALVARRPPAQGDVRLALAGGAVLVAVGVAQLSDLLTFIRMIGVAGLDAELNPLVARGAETLGLTFLAASKIALIVLVASVFAVVARRHRRTAAFVATAGTLAGLIGAFSNVLAIT